MTYRIVRTRLRGKPLTVASTWHNGIEASSPAEAIRKFRDANPSARMVPPEDFAAVEVERKSA